MNALVGEPQLRGSPVTYVLVCLTGKSPPPVNRCLIAYVLQLKKMLAVDFEAFNVARIGCIAVICTTLEE